MNKKYIFYFIIVIFVILFSSFFVAKNLNKNNSDKLNYSNNCHKRLQLLDASIQLPCNWYIKSTKLEIKRVLEDPDINPHYVIKIRPIITLTNDASTIEFLTYQNIYADPNQVLPIPTKYLANAQIVDEIKDKTAFYNFLVRIPDKTHKNTYFYYPATYDKIAVSHEGFHTSENNLIKVTINRPGDTIEINKILKNICLKQDTILCNKLLEIN